MTKEEIILAKFGVKKKEDEFFELLKGFMAEVKLTGEVFVDLVHNYENVEEKVLKVKERESACDDEAYKILQALRASFITPFDREDIYDIANEMDEIVDNLEEVANRFDVFDVKALHPACLQMTDYIMQAIRELEVMINHLSEIKKNTIVMEQIAEVNRIESAGDICYRAALKELFKEEKDPIELVKWKHIYERLETALDSCEKVANIVEGVVVKNA